MNRAELVMAIAADTGMSRSAVEEVLSSYVKISKAALARDESITIVGYGTMSVKTRDARTGRNPSTGESIEIPEKKRPSFKPGKPFIDALN